MLECESVLEASQEPAPSRCGDYGPVHVEMHDTLGVLTLGIVVVLLLWVLLREQVHNKVLTQALAGREEGLPSS